MTFTDPRRTFTLPAAVAAVGALTITMAPAVAQGPATEMRAETILPPGNSQTYTLDGEARGRGSGDPDQWGPWIDDQREMYWDYEMKDSRLSAPCPDDAPAVGTTDRQAGREDLDDDVHICWDEWGVPAVFGPDGFGVGFGHGWAAAKLRLFLLEGAVRTARGTLAEIAGPGSLAQDLERRTTRYSDEELTAMFDRMSPAAKELVNGYVAGVNLYIATVTTTARDQLPAEYVALTIEPQPITPEDVLAVGVEMVRFVATEGRREIANARKLRDLETAFGEAQGRAHFLDLYWDEDAEAAVTIFADEATFPRTTQTREQRLVAFDAMADFARTVPLELEAGPGIETDTAEGDPTLTNASVDVAGGVRQMFQAFANASEGGSWMVTIAPSRTADGSSLLMSEPQLDIDGGNFLMEAQITGGGYDARGATVAGIPVIGIGYAPRVAWAVTTGNAKTIDTFIERSQADSNGDGSPEYLHDGVWKEMDCRDEVLNYRDAAGPLPVGPAVRSETHTICRTVHGPVVAHTADWSAAASYQYHLWGRETETIEAAIGWNRAESVADIAAVMPLATWNENLMAADDEGNIAYWHPGLHLERSPDADLRLPIPGTGEFDNGDPLPFASLPQIVNPERGWIANWNNKPAHGWLDGLGQGATSYPAGIDARVASLNDLVGSRDDWTFDDLIELDREVSTVDFRTRHLLPMILALTARDDLTPLEVEALDLLAAWDRSAHGPGADMETTPFSSTDPATVGAAATIFDEFVDVLKEDLFAFLVDASPGLISQTYMGRHIYDVDPQLHLALRVLDPALSSLPTDFDYARGRTSDEVLRDVLAATVARLEADQGADATTWRSVYFDDQRGIDGGKDGEVCSATGVVGPCGRHWFIERGAWVHHVGYDVPGASVGPPPSIVENPPLPTTGGGLAALGALALVVGASARRRRSAR